MFFFNITTVRNIKLVSQVPNLKLNIEAVLMEQLTVISETFDKR